MSLDSCLWHFFDFTSWISAFGLSGPHSLSYLNDMMRAHCRRSEATLPVRRISNFGTSLGISERIPCALGFASLAYQGMLCVTCRWRRLGLLTTLDPETDHHFRSKSVPPSNRSTVRC
ncbi:hypothetical protein PILCRDRAFT_821129 [Piloderma croceum F 1598]|uniref:Uncharacterized protein n=1 Tax=Piloderma croceum (strain F 1598) TaxID=765440 RepID=A0A0C3BWN6_PILCF|nr:hypothetical protein PILCRDRAFT_821129 [Piloderma croceum F 1598]